MLNKVESSIIWGGVLIILVVVIIAIGNLKGCNKEATLNEVTIETNKKEDQAIEHDQQIKADHNQLSDAAIAERVLIDCRDCNESEVGKGSVPSDHHIETRQVDTTDSEGNRPTQYGLPQPQPCKKTEGLNDQDQIVWIEVCD